MGTAIPGGTVIPVRETGVRVAPWSVPPPLINPVRPGWILLNKPIGGGTTSIDWERLAFEMAAGGDGVETGLAGGGVGEAFERFCAIAGWLTCVGVGVLELGGGVGLFLDCVCSAVNWELA